MESQQGDVHSAVSSLSSSAEIEESDSFNVRVLASFQFYSN